jgi:TP901-1 family phage major tail protein
MAVSAGRVVLIKLDMNDTGTTTASWQTVLQQRGGSLGRTAETADSTHKDDAGWATFINTRKGWTVSGDGAMDASDSTFIVLKDHWTNQSRIWVQVDASAMEGTGEKVEGEAWITDLSTDFPESDVVTYTLELQGHGALVDSP